MQKNFRGRLYKFYGLEVNWMVRGMWKLAHRYVDEFTKRKLRIYGNDYQKELHADVPLANLEKKYGGEREDIKDNFWPPQFNWKETFNQSI